MYHYAANIFNHQHRQHVFSLHLHENTAMIARWDRAGAVVSEFNLNTHSAFFYDFVHRFGRLTREQQGYDTTAQFDSKNDVAKLLRYTTTNEYLKRYHEAVVSDLEEWPIYKVRPSPSRRPHSSLLVP